MIGLEVGSHPPWVEGAPRIDEAKALGIALSGMMQDQEITRISAVEIARSVLRGRAMMLRGWSEGP
jgi:hypothetical protein